MPKTFTQQDQERFAALSGDCNPMHTDPLAARRMMYGKPVVHGMHLVLWALDILVAEKKNFSINSIRTRFHSPVFVDEKISYEHRKKGDQHRISLFSNKELKAGIELETAPPLPEKASVPNGLTEALCRPLTAETITDSKGCFPISLDRKESSRLFSGLTKHLSHSQLASLAGLSQLVGMHCPGLYSIFSSFEAKTATGTDSNGHFKLDCFDDRFSIAQLSFSFPGLHGSLQAFLRPEQANQPGYQELTVLVKKSEFSHVQALVVGGTRGIGEITAKLLAAGGAQVRITYCRGRDDAERVCKEISTGGGDCENCQYDVLGAADRLSFLEQGWEPNTVFYYPTPPIFQGSRGAFSPQLFNQFQGFYVDGFLSLLELLPRKYLTVLYPSSVALDEIPPDMGEYVSAKAAGEALCSFLNKTRDHLEIHCPRLPRVRTDQTTSLSPVKNNDPVEIMLPLLRSLFKS